MKIAVPIAPRVCRNVLLMAVPSFILFNGSEFKPAVVDGINTKVIPITRTAYKTTISIIGVEVVSVVV